MLLTRNSPLESEFREELARGDNPSLAEQFREVPPVASHQEVRVGSLRALQESIVFAVWRDFDLSIGGEIWVGQEPPGIPGARRARDKR